MRYVNGVLSDFNPLPPQGGRPVGADRGVNMARISTHSLPKEGDRRYQSKLCGGNDFNPLPPQGGRQQNITAKFHIAREKS